MKQPEGLRDIALRPGQPLAQVAPIDQTPLPPPFDRIDEEPAIRPLSETARSSYVVLDDTIAVSIERPKTEDEERALVDGFLSGLAKLFSVPDNWTFLQPLEMSMEHCARCQTCSEACHIFEESGRKRALPADLPLRDPAPDLLQVRQGRRRRWCTATSTSTGRPWRG